jgi:hypothetical protein
VVSKWSPNAEYLWSERSVRAYLEKIKEASPADVFENPAESKIRASSIGIETQP